MTNAKEEGVLSPMNGDKPLDARPLSKEEVRKQQEAKRKYEAEMKRQEREEALRFADYKKRLKESVEVKRLQVEELELNVKFYKVSKEYEQISKLIEEEEALRKAEALKMKEDIEKKSKQKLEKVKVGKPRTDEEIEKNQELLK